MCVLHQDLAEQESLIAGECCSGFQPVAGAEGTPEDFAVSESGMRCHAFPPTQPES
ncbi:hypothetical protein [Nonomuraea sp. CA-141351]|uniref:hypothetical protein n=1 Tax=Nonomuraea sp. CA-141351 TaxID=3239996 RepID=UPI003D91E7D4